MLRPQGVLRSRAAKRAGEARGGGGGEWVEVSKLGVRFGLASLYGGSS